MNISKKYKIFILIFVFLNVILWTKEILDKRIIFNIDVSRDLLILEDIVKNRHLTLIGARSSINGLFHGPLWQYLNLPIFFISGGNPVFIGLFWIFLFIFLLISIFVVAKKIFSEKTAYLAVLILSIQGTMYIRSLINPFGAVIVFPLFFFFFYRYLKEFKTRYLSLSFFLIGLIIQFQVAFGAPILILLFLVTMYFILRNKRYIDLLSIFTILFPLSTFILFEILHGFIQTKSVLSFMTNNNHGGIFNQAILEKRFIGFFTNGIQAVLRFPVWELSIVVRLLNLLVFFTLFSSSFISIKKRDKNKLKYLLFSYFYIGFWFITIFFKIDVQWYYFWPFWPLIIMFFCNSFSYINKYVFMIIFTAIFSINAFYSCNSYKKLASKFTTWNFYKKVSDFIFNDSKVDFGYFINTLDQYSSYPIMYAMIYSQKNYRVQSHSLVKKPVIYIIVGPNPDGTRFDNNWFKKNRVKIDKKADKAIGFDKGFVAEQYSLTEKEQQAPIDPNIFQSLHFR